MISNNKIKLLEIWNKNHFMKLSMIEIMKLSNKRTKTWVFNALKLLVKKKIIISEKKANLNLYQLNTRNPLSFQLLHYIEVQKNIDFPKKEVIAEIIEKIPIKNYSLLVFGSYAENKQNPKSDIDLCFLIEDKEQKKRIMPYINEIKLNHAITIDEQYILFDELVEMLLRNEENLGKQIVRKHKIFYNADIYYQLLKEAHKHGFRQ
mgnify:CR=1 FL=1